MGRHRKVKPAGLSPEEGLAQEQQLRETLRQIAATKAAVAATLDSGEASPQLVREFGGLCRAEVSVSGELRALEVHRAKIMPIPKSPDELAGRIVELFEGLPGPRKVDLARTLTQIAGDGTLLGR